MKCLASIAILLFNWEISCNSVRGQTCFGALKRDSDPSDPPFSDNNGNDALNANNNVQAIITTYRFQECDCVNITTWETYVQPGGNRHQSDYDITFQVWRPSPTNSECYSLVGQNAFTSVSLSGGGFVQLTPTPQAEIIMAKLGDVVGYYTDSRMNANEGIQLDRDRDYNENQIWYLPLGGNLPMFTGTANNLASVGVNGYLTSSTNAAPVLKISTSSVNCPPSPPPMAVLFTCPPAIQSSTQFLSTTTTVRPPSLATSETRDEPNIITIDSIIPVSSSHTNVLLTSTASSPVTVAENNPTLISSPEPSSFVASISSSTLTLQSSITLRMTQKMASVSLSTSTPQNSITPRMTQRGLPLSIQVTPNFDLTISPELASLTIQPSRSQTQALIQSRTSSSSSSGDFLSTESSSFTPTQDATEAKNSITLRMTQRVASVSTQRVASVSLSTSTPQNSITPRMTLRGLPSSIQVTPNFDLTISLELASITIQPSRSQTQALIQSRTSSSSSSRDFLSTESFSFTPTQDTTEANPRTLNSGSLITTIVVIVVLLIILGCLSAVIAILLVRRKISARKVKFDNAGLDLNNPNYESSSATFFLKESKAYKAKVTSKSSAEVTSSQIEDSNYESLEYKLPLYSTAEPLDYSLPLPSQPQPSWPGVSSKPYKYSSDIHTSSGNDGLDDNSLYHDVGPASTNISEAPPLPSRNSVRETHSKLPKSPLLQTNVVNSTTSANIDYVELEEPLEESKIFHENSLPTQMQKFKAEDFNGEGKSFESIGNYVPTEEERTGSCETRSVVQVKQPMENKMKNTFFVDEAIYWEPATTTSGLYSQLAVKKYREISRDQIRLKSTIGSGQFGEVCKAIWSLKERELDLAVKTLKTGASEQDKVKFLQEAAIMGQFSHTNVIKMYGVVTVGEPVLICLEILENGDLREYLQTLNLVGSKYEDFIDTQLRFLKFAKDIAAGMRYLSKKNFVHRDLAARNVLLNKFMTCKVADFGMTRDLMDDTYYTSSGGKIPVKWTAPEALLYKKYSTDSDVWSYGMVLFEIWSVGRKPFSTLTNPQTLKLLQQGFCQSPPPGCPRAIYELMVDCWNPKRQSRPSFETISVKYLSQSEEKLLHWALEDDKLSPSVGVCGASLLEAEDLYLDLQKKYMTK